MRVFILRVMLRVVMLSVIMANAVMLSVIMLKVFILRALELRVDILNWVSLWWESICREPTCLVSLFWMSLRSMSLYWVSWRLAYRAAAKVKQASFSPNQILSKKNLNKFDKSEKTVFLSNILTASLGNCDIWTYTNYSVLNETKWNE